MPGIASDTSKTPESGPAGREDATPAGYQAMRIPSDIQTPVQSIGNLLEEDDAIEEHRTAREIPMAAYRSRQSVGRLIFIAAGIVLMAALPTIFLERDLYSAPQSRSAQPSAERAGLPRSAPASSPTPPVRTTISVQPVPALRGGEANASQAIEQPVAAGETGKPAPRTEATNKVVQRPLTEEEKAAVARGLEALGVQESDTTNNRDGRPQSAR